VAASLQQSLNWHTIQLPGTAAISEIPLKVGRVGDHGPKVVLIAGVHGDEGPWGALALTTFLERPVTQLKAQLTVILAANPLAAQADARNAPHDTLDLNRSFPGSTQGSHTERLAAALARWLEDSEVVIDLHGGGSWCVNAFAFRFGGSEKLAESIGAPFIVNAPEKAGTLTQFAKRQGASVLAVEMGGRSREEMRWRDRISQGIERVLYNLDLLRLETPPAASPPAVEVENVTTLRPSRGGIFVPTLREDAVGTLVDGGTELGRLLDLHTLEPIETFTAPHPRTALLLLRPHVCCLEGGAMTYVIAQPKERT
jgi:predicted deacylase